MVMPKRSETTSAAPSALHALQELSSAARRFDMHNVPATLHLIKHLTRQTNVQDLINALHELLSHNFSDSHVTVYELRATRSEYSKLQCIVCIDCTATSPALYLNDEEDMYKAYLEKQDVMVPNGHLTTLFLPIELSDRSLSHMVRVLCPNQADAIILMKGILEIFRDILRNLHENAYDPLTRILNRQAFDQIAADLAYGGPQAKRSHPFGSDSQFKAIAILDIDRFKKINDQYGHAIGDETLVLFAQSIRGVLRQEDLFFRYGGEEFVILVKDVDCEQALNVLERCREAIESRRFPQVGQATVSIGFADLAANAHPVETLSKADKALYFAKHHGRNQVCSYDELVRNGKMKPVEMNTGSVDFWD